MLCADGNSWKNDIDADDISIPLLPERIVNFFGGGYDDSKSVRAEMRTPGAQELIKRAPATAIRRRRYKNFLQVLFPAGARFQKGDGQNRSAFRSARRAPVQYIIEYAVLCLVPGF